MRKRNMAIIGAATAVLVVGGFIYANPKAPVASPNCQTLSTLSYSADGVFTPGCVKIKSNTTLTYVNTSSSELQVGANPHPIHSGNRELSNNEYVLKVAPGAKANVTPMKTGSFSIHNHLKPSSEAIIVVE